MNNVIALREAADIRARAAETLKVVEFRTSYDFTPYGRRTAIAAPAAPVSVPVTTSPKWVEDSRGIPVRVR